MSATFNLTRDQVIKMSLQVCGKLGSTQSPSSTDITDCSLFLGALLKFWSTQKGFDAWCYQTINWACVANKISYTIGEAGADVINVRPLKIAQGWTVATSGGDIQPLVPSTREQFNRLSPRTSEGPTTTYYYDPQLTRGIYHVWPVPTDTTRSFYASIVRPINDILLAGDNFDLPQEGLLAVVWGLAELIMPMYGVEEMTQRRIEKNAPIFLEAFTSFNEEDGSVFFQPSSQGRK